MDLSVSYHPISKEQMREWYFDAFEDIGVTQNLKVRIPDEQLKEHSLEELEAYYLEKYTTMIKRSRELDYDSFNKWHGYFLAIVQGFFEKFYFTHGSAISAIVDTDFHNTYVTSWEDIIPSDYIEDLNVSKKLTGEFSAGAYLSATQVKQLLNDYKTNEEVKEILDMQFPGRKIEVILAVLEYASQNDQGIIEATRVIHNTEEIFGEPACFSNLFNCDVLSSAVYTADLADHFEEIYKGTGD